MIICFDINVQYKKENSSEQASFTMTLKSMPAVGDFVQFKDGKALKVERVYHIPKLIDQIDNNIDADAILFVKFVNDLDVSDY